MIIFILSSPQEESVFRPREEREEKGGKGFRLAIHFRVWKRRIDTSCWCLAEESYVSLALRAAGMRKALSLEALHRLVGDPRSGDGRSWRSTSPASWRGGIWLALGSTQSHAPITRAHILFIPSTRHPSHLFLYPWRTAQPPFTQHEAQGHLPDGHVRLGLVLVFLSTPCNRCDCWRPRRVLLQ